jgi:membrane-bound metal-dependent hydrolase YbcI (DUF457 family)
MATPVGHYLLGFAVAQVFAQDESQRKRAFWLANVAWIPDLDVLPGLMVGNLGQFHHGATHSLTAAATFALLGLLVAAQKTQHWSLRLFPLLFLLYASHIFLDYLTLDTGAPYGVPLFWPFWLDSYASPLLLLPNVQHSSAPLISVHNLLLALQEALLFLPLAGLIYTVKGWWPNWSPAWVKVSGWFCGGWFLLAVAASAWWINGANQS